MLGRRARDRPFGAHDRRMPVRVGGGRDGAHRPARASPARRRRGHLSPAGRAPGAGDGPGRVPPGEATGDGPAARQVRGHALQPGAQYEGEPGRLARPPCDRLDRAGRRLRPQPCRARRQRAHDPRRGAALPGQPADAHADPRHAAYRGRASRGPPGLRPAGAGGAGARLRRPQQPARLRAHDAALLLGGEIGHAAQHHPDAEPGRACDWRACGGTAR